MTKGQKKHRISGQRELASALGRSLSTANAYTRRADWRWGDGPWSESDLAEIRQWLPTIVQPSSASPQLRAARVELMAAQLLLLNLLNGIASGKFCDFREVESLSVAAIYPCKQVLMDLCWRFRTEYVGSGQDELRVFIEGQISNAIEIFNHEIDNLAERTTCEPEPLRVPRRRQIKNRRAQGAVAAGAAGNQAAVGTLVAAGGG